MCAPDAFSRRRISAGTGTSCGQSLGVRFGGGLPLTTAEATTPRPSASLNQRMSGVPARWSRRDCPRQNPLNESRQLVGRAATTGASRLAPPRTFVPGLYVTAVKATAPDGADGQTSPVVDDARGTVAALEWPCA